MRRTIRHDPSSAGQERRPWSLDVLEEVVREVVHGPGRVGDAHEPREALAADLREPQLECAELGLPVARLERVVVQEDLGEVLVLDLGRLEELADTYATADAGNIRRRVLVSIAPDTIQHPGRRYVRCPAWKARW